MFESIRGHTLFTPALGQNPVVLDLGANHGDFSRQMKQRFGGTYYLAEANPVLARMLADEGLFHVWPCAVTDKDGPVDFNIFENDEASSLFNSPENVFTKASAAQRVTMKGRSIHSLLAEMPSSRVDLIKIDIEGVEARVLLSLSKKALGQIGQMTVEFHDDPCFGLDISKEVQESIRYLRRNGFLFLNFSGTTASETTRTDILFLNRRLNKIPFGQGRLWEMVTARPQWLRKLKQRVPQSLRGKLDEIFNKVAGRKET